MRRFVLFAIASLFAASAFATPVAPVLGAEYIQLKTPQPVQSKPGQIEVMEFFMYHCPACNLFEPALAEWVKKQGDKIVFRRFHLGNGAPRFAEPKLFLTLDAMQLSESMHAKVLQAWHVEHRHLQNDKDNLDWAVANGIDKTRFLETYNSFGVGVKLRNLERISNNYQVDSTPTLIVGGRYLTNPSMVEIANRGLPESMRNDATLQVLDALLARAQKDK